MAKRLGRLSQSWRTFVNSHRSAIVAVDVLTGPTARIRVLYVFVVLSLERRRIAHFNVTDSPTAAWTSLQLIQAFPFDTAPRHVIRDRDIIYGEKVGATLRALGIKDKVVGYQSPWQNGYVERVIGSIRRECLDHVIVFGEQHLPRVLREYFAYYHRGRRQGLPASVMLPTISPVGVLPHAESAHCPGRFR